MTLDRPAARPYGSPELGSHYQGQTAATESRYPGTKSTARASGNPNQTAAPAGGANQTAIE